MTKEQLLSRLLEKKEQLAKRVLAIETDFKKGRSQDFSEQATETENDGVLDEIHHEAKIELQQVVEALQRLEHNKYGLCSHCDEVINPQRLQVLPYTNTCINCAQ